MAIAQRNDYETLFDPAIDTLAIVRDSYLEEPDYEAMMRGAIDGMLESLDDRYTVYIPPEDLKEFDKQVRGEFVGIGAEVRDQDGWILIVSPLEDSPAYRAGIEAGDLIVAVDGESIHEMGVNTVIGHLTGESGTEVRITLEREGTNEDIPRGALAASVADAVDDAPGPQAGTVRFDVVIVRKRIEIHTVKGLQRLGEKWNNWADPQEKIAYVRLTQFTSTSARDLARTLLDLTDEGVRGLILDLRFNGGGEMRAAVTIADLFVDDGVIVSTKGRNPNASREFVATQDIRLPGAPFPLVVLVNGSSASASEIVAGALVDNGRAIILGERSFGKGLVQTLRPLPSGMGQIKVTEAYYFLPSGRCIQRTDEASAWGVDPSPGFYVPMEDEDILEMLRVRREREIIRPEEEADPCCWDDPVWIREQMKDPQLSAAIETIAAKLSTGEWKQTGQDAPEGTLELSALRDAERYQEGLIRQLTVTQRRIDALESFGRDADDPRDLIPDDANLVGGKIDIYDADGEIVARLDITGQALERWLTEAPVKAAVSN